MKVVNSLATVIDERKKGTPIEEAVKQAFEPPKTEQQEQQQPPEEQIPGLPENTAMPGAELPQSQAPMSMQNLLAGLSGSGSPVLKGNIQRQIPA